MLTRSFWMKEAGAAAPMLSPEIAPSMEVNQQDDFSLAFLRNERLAYAFVAGAAPGAGLYRYCQFFNPPGSGMLAMVRRISVYTATAGELIGNWSTLGGPGNPGAARTITDARWFTTSVNQPVCNGQATTSAVAPSFVSACAYYQQIVAATINTRLERDVRFVVPPGQSLAIGHSVIATPSLLVDFDWLERPIGAEELSTG